MFPRSTQRKHWMFPDENKLNQLREKTNHDYIATHGIKLSVSQKI